MRILAGCLLLAAALGVAGVIPAAASATASYTLTKRCVDASGFTDRAVRDPAYISGKVYADAKELAYINRCVRAVTGTPQRIRNVQAGAGSAPSATHAVRGALPLPSQYPLMRGDAALWGNLTMAQQRRAMQFLQSGSTIRSSLFGD